jgi:hypothetical protein
MRLLATALTSVRFGQGPDLAQRYGMQASVHSAAGPVEVEFTVRWLQYGPLHVLEYRQDGWCIDPLLEALHRPRALPGAGVPRRPTGWARLACVRD